MFKPKLIAGFKEKCGFYKEGKKARRQEAQERCWSYLLFYGVSVGEVIAMENLIKKTRETFPAVNITLMTGTKTGQEIAHKKLSETCDFITYFPFDFPFSINNMLKKSSQAPFLLWKPNYGPICKYNEK